MIVMMAITCLSAASAIAFAFLFFTSRVSTSGLVNPILEFARPQTKLEHPVVILVSSDGFRFGYQYKTETPNIDRLVANGTIAEDGMIPVFPTLTFPNHYAIVTGLYPAWHGIINNHFRDPNTNDTFSMQNHEPKWWLGEPLWETVTKNGLPAATYFWPGSEVIKGPWNCPKGFCQQYNGSVPFEERVDTVLGYFDLKASERPRFMTLYFEDPDHQGHQVGPDDPQITGEDQQRMSNMIDQLQIRDSLRMYNSLVERCFNNCVDSFRRKTLDKQEETCVQRCAEKYLKHSMRVSMRFAELNQGSPTPD